MAGNVNLEAIILAGGKGTRLHKTIGNIPKPMADIGGKPFLQYILEFLLIFGFSKVILSVGYKSEDIQCYFGNSYKSIDLDYCIEETPLGTGGAIKKSFKLTSSDNVLIINGDTFFAVDIQKMLKHHIGGKRILSVALKKMSDFDRYGTVKVLQNIITGFLEKKYQKKGFINGGFYIADKKLLDFLPNRKSFSFEKDFLEQSYREIEIAAYISSSYFIDIGIPEDYYKAVEELPDLKGLFK